jgi:hypothetical protein
MVVTRRRIEAWRGLDRTVHAAGEPVKWLVDQGNGSLGDPRLLRRGHTQVDWHGNRAQQEASVQDIRELPPGGQRDRDPLAGAHSTIAQLLGRSVRTHQQLRV